MKSPRPHLPLALVTGLIVCLLLATGARLSAQVVEQALEGYGTYCTPENSNGRVSLERTVVRKGAVALRHSTQAVLPRRAELDDCSFHAYDPDRTYWYGLSLYLTEAGFGSRDFEQYVGQWRFSNLPQGGPVPNCEMFRECGGGRIYGGSGHHLLARDGRWVVTLAVQDPGCGSCEALDHVEIDLGSYRTEVWTDLVFRMDFSHEVDGAVDAWVRVAGEDYRQVASYRGRTWLEFYQARSAQRTRGVLDGRVMAPNHTVGLYWGSDRGARTMYSDEIRTYQEELGRDGFSVVAIDGEARPSTPAVVGPQAWLRRGFGAYEEAFDLRLKLTPRGVFAEAGYLGLCDDERANDLADLAVVVQYAPDGTLRALDGAEFTATQAVGYSANVDTELYLRTDPVARRYSAGVVRTAGDTAWFARDYRWNAGYRGTDTLRFVVHDTPLGAGLDVTSVDPIFLCGPQAAQAIDLAAPGGAFALGFALEADGSNFVNGEVSLADDDGAYLTLALDEGFGLTATDGATASAAAGRVGRREKSRFKIAVDPNGMHYTVSVTNADGRERTLVRDLALARALDPSKALRLGYATTSGGCLTLDSALLVPLELDATCGGGATFRTDAFPLRAGRFVVQHNLRIAREGQDTSYFGIGTKATVADRDDLSAYVAVVPDGTVLVREGEVLREVPDFFLVSGERYSATWTIDGLTQRSSLTLEDAFGTAVIVSTFAELNASRRDRGNSYQYVGYGGAGGGACLVSSTPRLNPCGPVAWQSESLPERSTGAYELSFDLLPGGGTFARGELHISSTRVPTATTSYGSVYFTADGKIRALDGRDTSAATDFTYSTGRKLGVLWTTDPGDRRYNVSVSEFGRFSPIADRYRANADWDGSRPRYLAYRTQTDGCLTVSELLEGAPCGPEEWTSARLTTPVRGTESITVALTPDGNNFRDGVWGLTHLATPTDFSDLAVIIQFDTDGRVKVRDGEVYRADEAFAYVYGETYTFTVDVNYANRRYDISYERDGDRIYLARGYGFRQNWTGAGAALTHAAQRTVGAGCLVAASGQFVSSVPTVAAAESGLTYLGNGRFRLGAGAAPARREAIVYDATGRILMTFATDREEFTLPQRLGQGVFVMVLWGTRETPYAVRFTGGW